MSLVHIKSHLGVTQELDFFSLPITETGILGTKCLQFSPLVQISDNSDVGPVEFFLPPISDYYMISSLQLYVKVRIVKENGGKIASADKVSFSNLLHSSLFQGVEMALNSKPVHYLNNLWSYQNFIPFFTNTSFDYKMIQGILYGFKPDSKPSDYSITNKVQEHFKERMINGSYIELFAPLNLPLVKQGKLLIPHMGIHLKFHRNKPEFVMFKDPTETSKFFIDLHEMTLHIKKRIISPTITLELEKKLISETSKYPLSHVIMRQFQITKNSLLYSAENIFQNNIPERMVVCFIETQALIGDYTKNPYHFQNCKLQEAFLTVDSEPIPNLPFKVDFDKHEYFKFLNNFHDNLGQLHTTSLTSGMTYLDFQHHMFLIWDLSLSGDASLTNDYAIQKQGNVKLTLRFHESLPEATTLLIYAEIPRVLEIDSARQVFHNMQT